MSDQAKSLFLRDRPSPWSIARGKHLAAGGFTLIELLVALMLASILSLAIMTISSSASNTYIATVDKVSVFNNFRLAMKSLQTDLAGWIPSQELEFYVDGAGNNSRRDYHYSPGEEIKDRTDEHGPGVVNGGDKGYDEFASVEQRHYSSLEPWQVDEGFDQPKVHDAYQLYFRTMTFVDGMIREANVEYLLVDPSAPRKTWVNGIPPAPTKVAPGDVAGLSLYKVIRYLEITEDSVTNLNYVPIRRRILEVAPNVTDFRVEYLSSDPFTRSVRDGELRFRTPEEDYEDPTEAAIRPSRQMHKDGEPSYRKSFGYGSINLSNQIDLAIAETAVWGDNNLRGLGRAPQPVRIGFRGNQRIRFAELVPGDRLYIFTSSERGQARNQQNTVGRITAFPAGDYTILSNLSGMLELREDIDSSTWGEGGIQGIRYKAAYTPAALRITLRMVDDEGKNPKSMQQVVWLRRRAQ